jgi:hypothetical protein
MGWGDAWAGLSQQAFAATINSLEEREQRKYQDKRDQIARKAADSQERSRREYEEKMFNKRAALDAQARQEDFKMRKGLAMQEQSFRAQESAADRALREQQMEQTAAYNQGMLGIQQQGLGLRQKEIEASTKASKMGSAAGGVSANRVDTALMQEYSLISEAGDSEAKAAAAAIYGSGLPLDQKLARLRALRGRLDTPTDMEMIR